MGCWFKPEFQSFQGGGGKGPWSCRHRAFERPRRRCRDTIPEPQRQLRSLCRTLTSAAASPDATFRVSLGKPCAKTAANRVRMGSHKHQANCVGGLSPAKVYRWLNKHAIPLRVQSSPPGAATPPAWPIHLAALQGAWHTAPPFHRPPPAGLHNAGQVHAVRPQVLSTPTRPNVRHVEKRQRSVHRLPSTRPQRLKILNGVENSPPDRLTLLVAG